MRYVLCFFLVALAIACSQDKKIKLSDVRGAERIIGLEFSESEEDTLLDYLRENREGFDSMRALHLPYEITPALYFDPRPANFVPRQRQGPSEWSIPDEVQLPSSDADIAFLPVSHLSALIRSRKITSMRLTKIYLERLKHYKDTLQAVVTITEDLAMRQAARADEEVKAGKIRGPLHGIPYGIKDLFAVPGYKTTWGAEPYQEQYLADTAAVVKRLEEAGAVLVAKLVSGALARGDVWFGGKTKNPWDLKQGASGSSAGSGSATAAGLVAFSIGTETLGSILAPSGRCGATGLRPTFGAVSRDGCMTLSWSMDKAGPICRTAQDCALVFDAIKGRNPGEADRSVTDYPFFFHKRKDLAGFRIGYFKKFFDKDSSNTGSNNARTLEEFKKLGAVLEPVELPDSIPFKGFDIILRAESGAFFDELVREHRERLMSEQDKGSRANSLRQARFIPAVEYLQANRYRTVMIEKLQKLFSRYDIIIAPAQGFRLSLATNLSGHPAISVPNGFDKKGHPTAVILYGNLYDEGPLLEAAWLFQMSTAYEEKHPELFGR